MKKIFMASVLLLLVSSVAFAQGGPEKYIGQYQLTGVPLVITVTVEGGKVMAQATGQPKFELELVSGDSYAVKGIPIKITFQSDPNGVVTGLTVNQSGTDVPATKINASTEAPRDKSPHKSEFVTANGIKMNYLDWGGTGDVVILLSGFGNDAHIFDEFAPSLTDKFHVIGLTRRGFGETDRPASGYETETRVEDVRAFMDALQIPKAHLVGHSLAGDEITMFAEKYPQRVNKLVYLDAAYNRKQMFTCATELPAEIVPTSALRMLREAMNCPGWADIVVKDLPAPDLYSVQVQTMRSATQFVPGYRRVKASSLAIYADPEVPQLPPNLSEEAQKRIATYWKEKQAPLSRASIEQFRKEMRNGEVVEIKGATHYVFVGPYKNQTIKLTHDFLTK
jgi:pimeloyl-ACP methyl ester carboxylesterase